MRVPFVLLLMFCFAIISKANVAETTCINCEAFLVEAADLKAGESRLIVADEDLIFLYKAVYATTNRVFLCCGIQYSMQKIRVEDNIWGWREHIPNLNQAILSYSFSEYRDAQHFVSSNYQYWRGENAPAAPEQANPLQGKIEVERLVSPALRETRRLSIYYPPEFQPYQENAYPVVYVADGQNVWSFAAFIEPLILSGQIRPMLLIGLHSGNYRAEEYLPDYEPERFAAHEIFFIEEVRNWAETQLGASRMREERAIYGVSNGGVFAAAMALKHPELYGIAFPFSAGLAPYPDVAVTPNQRLYFAAGTFERGFFTETRGLAERFAGGGADVRFSARIAGHDLYMWDEEIRHGILWAFGN